MKKTSIKRKPKTTPSKATKAEVHQRVMAVYTLILESKSNDEILQFISDSYKLSERQSYTYIEKARDILKEVIMKDADERIAIIVRKQWQLLESATKANNHETARKILTDLLATQGLKSPEKLEVTNIDKQVKEADTATLLKIVKK